METYRTISFVQSISKWYKIFHCWIHGHNDIELSAEDLEILSSKGETVSYWDEVLYFHKATHQCTKCGFFTWKIIDIIDWKRNESL